MVADQAASKFNVTWSRTTPIAVSVCDDAYDGYMTLECDHRFGMDVTGDSSNVYAFRFAFSSTINPIERGVMKTLLPSIDDSFEVNSSLGRLCSSITIGLGQILLNGEMVDIFVSNGYLVIKSADNRLFLVLDLETGIVRDVMVTNNSTFSYSSWCYSDQQTEGASELGEKLLNNLPEWLSSIDDICLSKSWALMELGVATAKFLAPLLLPLMTINLIDSVMPGAIEVAERNGRFDRTIFLIPLCISIGENQVHHNGSGIHYMKD